MSLDPSPNEEFKAAVFSPDSQYSDIYLARIQYSQYNFILSDYSYFQFTWSSETKLRYAYYPNPFIGAANNQNIEFLLSGDDTILSFDFELWTSICAEAEFCNHVPLIRYEFAESQYRHLQHPTSHFHIGFHSKTDGRHQ